MQLPSAPLHQPSSSNQQFQFFTFKVDTLSYKTISANAATVDKQWLLVDAEGVILGRLASKVAKLIRGKHKTNFTPHVDCGDNVVVINADKVILSGKKESDRLIYSYSGYPGGRHDKTVAAIRAKDSRQLVRHAVKGMLPKNRLGDKLLGNLYVFPSSEHDKEAQQPKKIDINEIAL